MIAEAARPALGDAGFTIMAVAALLATASSVLATLYASAGLTKMLAEVGQFPPFFGHGFGRTRLAPKAGLLITAAIVLVGIAATAIVLVFFAVDTFRNAPQTFTAIVAIALLAVVLDFVWKRWRDRPGSSPDEDALTPATPG